MSMDIRSYFSKGSGNSIKPKDSPTKSSRGKKRSHRVIESDSEDDEIIVTSTQKRKHEVKTNSKSKPQEKKPEVVVQVENFFGKTPVIQKKQKTVTPQKRKSGKEEEPSPKKDKTNSDRREKSKSGKKKKEHESKNNKSGDSSFFEYDDELEASILQIDDSELVSGVLSSGKKDKNSAVGSVKDNLESSPSKSKTKSSDSERNKTPKKEKQDKTPKKQDNATVQNKTPKRENKKPETSSIPNSDQKRKNAEAYQKYLHRSGPKNPGSKTIPKGSPNCLQGLTFVITGVLDSLEREEAVELIQKYGGRVTSQVSKKTHFVVVGEEPGASKIQKADQFQTKKINEDELLDLIVKKSDGGCEKTESPEKTSKYFSNSTKTPKKSDVKEKKEESKKVIKVDLKPGKSSPVKDKSVHLDAAEDKGKAEIVGIEKTEGDMLWVDKYRPKSTKNIVGQTGDKSNVKKLIKWLQNWHKNHSSKSGKKLTKPAPWAQNDDGAYYKAALLSGPPGVGKTTSIHLVCQELGFDIIEFNASDTRSKRLLQEEVTELLSSKSIRGFLEGSGESYQKHVLVMDEVDGMAGNEDRGGIQELIQIIKTTKIPIVGICNDRNHPKMRSLVNYCFDLRFQRPRVEQIKGAMKSICFKEKLDISGEALEELIVSSNHDVRQILHSLSVLAAGGKNSLSLEEAKRSGQQSKKPLNLSPWDVVRKVFSSSEQEKMTFSEKSDLFFQDYSLGPLFVQDAYLRVKPYKANNNVQKTLELISKAADSLVLGDVVEKTIRSQNAWSLLPLQAVFSSIAPGHHMRGHVQGQIQFPVWLGKNSRRNKFDRLLQELNSSLRLSISGTKESVNMDYLNHLKDSIVRPLIKEGAQGVPESVKFMLEYHLTREDLDHILELSEWPGIKDTFSEVEPKVKAALTRALNKECQTVSHKSQRTKRKADNELEDDEMEEEEEEDETSDNIDLDPMIKRGKPKKAKTEEKSSKEKSSSSKKETAKKPEKAKKKK